MLTELASSNTQVAFQEISQASMWLLCAFVGWGVSFLILGYRNRTLEIPTKGKAGSDAFRKEVAAYASNYSSHVAANHFGVSESEVQDYSASSFANSADSETQEASIDSKLKISLEAPLCTAPSVHPGQPIPASAFTEINAEEFYEGESTLSLWLLPEGFVYDVQAENWVNETT